MNENQWLEKAKQNDEEAITQLIELTQHNAYFVAKRYVKKDSDAEDVLQESYIKALANLDKVKDHEHFIKWFHCIVANTSKDFLKKKNLMLFSDISDENNDIEIEDTRIEFVPDQAHNYKEQQRMVMEIIDRLPDDQRMCLIMYYYDQLNGKEIAEALQIPEATVKSRLKYAKNKLVYEVEAYEKANDVKLHSSAVFSFVAYVLMQEAKDCKLPNTCKISNGIYEHLSKQVKKERIGFIRTTGFKWLITATVAIFGVLGYFIWQYESDLMTLKKSTITVEYGTEFSFKPSDYVQCKRERVCELAEVTIDFKKVKDRSYAEVGTYEGRVIHRNEEEKFNVSVKDTKKPTIELKKDKITFTEGEAFEPSKNIKSVKDPVDGNIKERKDKSIIKNGYIIKNTVDKNKPGNYTVRVLAYDKNGNKTEKSYAVTVKKKPKPKQAVKTQNTFSAPSIKRSEVGSSTGVAVANAAKKLVGKSSVWYAEASCINTAAAAMEGAGLNSDQLYKAYHDLGKGNYKKYEVSSLKIGDVIMYYSTLGVYHTCVYIGNGMAVHGGFPHVAEVPQEGMVTVQISTYNCAAASEVKFFRFW